MREDHRERFSIISHWGLEQSKVALMGYKNSPAHVQRFMDYTLKKLREFAGAFVDIVIYSNTAQEHLMHLEAVCTIFAERQLALAPLKSFLGYPSVQLLAAPVGKNAAASPCTCTSAQWKFFFFAFKALAVRVVRVVRGA